MSINPMFNAWTIGPISNSLLSAINRTSQSKSLSSGGKLEGQSPMDNVRLNAVIEQSDLTLEPKGSVENAEQIAAQLHKPIRHKFYRRNVIVYNLDEIWA